MNALISELGGAHLKGLVIGLFTVSAGFSRPFSGKLADFIGRKKTMYIGIVIALIVCMLYPFAFSVWFLLTLRFIHGFCQGFFPTGATALVTDVLPEKHRGTGMGIWGTFISLGIGIGQGLSTILVDNFSRNILFLTAGVMVVCSLLLNSRVAETLKKPVPFKWSLLKIKKNELIEPHVMPVAIVMFFSAICSGIIFVLSPDMSGYHGIRNKGIFFLFYVLATIFVRLFTGKVSDLYGRRQTLLVGMILLTISMVCIGQATNAVFYMLASVLFGIATGIASPTIFAWTADLSPKNRRGIGAGTMFIALEFGILAGALITNVIYENNRILVPVIFNIGALCSTITVIYLIWHLRYRKSPH